MLFLKENKEALQALIDIDYLMRTYNYDVQKACGILFKDKRNCLPVFVWMVKMDVLKRLSTASI
ncbi:hypothetical protein SFC43_13530 [Bacteroides sp. CR5/BHMF/2]|nr:hypothetical protein [Bacteroides sp. CR5/BHMF/2]